SAPPYEKNLANTVKVAAAAKTACVSIEAELGRIVGVEEDIAVDDDESSLADPDEAVAFCKAVDLAAFAPAIGTAHGVYKGKPKISFERVEEIWGRTGVPLALHGGTGLEEDVFHKCISLGCAKVNISTQIKYAFIDGFVDYHNEHRKYEPLKPLGAQLVRIKMEVAEKIKLFGGEGKAK
ncbi:MAG: class II fructose-bisphosphate aldolase, partial [Planctomycetia bacterium]|nr:class II fructose-bisphosphate aldolase [Planctomycetia bacterium]